MITTPWMRGTRVIVLALAVAQSLPAVEARPGAITDSTFRKEYAAFLAKRDVLVEEIQASALKTPHSSADPSDLVALFNAWWQLCSQANKPEEFVAITRALGVTLPRAARSRSETNGAEFEEFYSSFERQIEDDATSPPNSRAAILMIKVYRGFARLGVQKYRDGLRDVRPSLIQIRANLDRLTQTLCLYLQPADVDYTVAEFEETYGRCLEWLGDSAEDMETEKRHWQRFAKSAHPAAKKAAEDGLANLQFRMKRAPMDFAFVSVDGRAINSQALRGKVVLIDFWATWCAPCIAEMPNVVAAHAKYHDLGFEVIGVSCDQAPRDGGNPKAGKTPSDISAFAKAHGLVWPQFYDGTGPENIMARQFHVKTLPGTFLLDQHGIIVSSDCSGPALEREVRRLLQLPPIDPAVK